MCLFFLRRDISTAIAAAVEVADRAPTQAPKFSSFIIYLFPIIFCSPNRVHSVLLLLCGLYYNIFLFLAQSVISKHAYTPIVVGQLRGGREPKKEQEEKDHNP